MLDPARFALSEHTNQDWTVTVETGTSLEDILNVAFFSNVANRLRPYDRIRVRIDTGEFYAELLVLGCGKTWAKTVPIFSMDLAAKADEKMQESNDEYRVQWRGPHLKFCIIRNSDNEPVKERLETKADAEAWLVNYAKVV